MSKVYHLVGRFKAGEISRWELEAGLIKLNLNVSAFWASLPPDVLSQIFLARRALLRLGSLDVPPLPVSRRCVGGTP